MVNYDSKPTGEFKEKEHGKYFTYKRTNDPFALQHGLEYEVDVLDGFRYAKVLQTVVYVSVDEDAEGKPVLERWEITQHKIF